MTMMRISLSEGGLQSLQTDAQRRSLIRLGLNLGSFAGIAFLWFIGVMREQAWQHSGPLVLNGLLGSGLLFLAMLFVGAVNSTILLAMLPRPNLNPDLSGYGRSTTQTPISSTPCGWQRIHAVGEYRRAPHLGHVAVGLLSRLSRCADSARGSGGAQVVSAPVSPMGLC